jgi:hypothetical protein
MDLSEVVEFLRELPGDQRVRTLHVQSKSSTVLVDSRGVARVVRDHEDDARWFIVELPTRH